MIYLFLFSNDTKNHKNPKQFFRFTTLTLSSISPTTTNNHFEALKVQAFNLHLLSFHFTPTKLHFLTTFI